MTMQVALEPNDIKVEEAIDDVTDGTSKQQDEREGIVKSPEQIAQQALVDKVLARRCRCVWRHCRSIQCTDDAHRINDYWRS